MNLLNKFPFFVLFGYILTDKLPFNTNFIKNKHIDAFLERCSGVCNEKYCKIFKSCRPVNRTSKLKKTDIYFHAGVKFEAPVLLEIRSYKKFATKYRPLLISVKEEVCHHLLMKTHPLFNFFGVDKRDSTKGNLLDPCPITGHRYEAPKYTTAWIGYLVPVGEWRVDFTLSKIINGSDEHIVTSSDYYTIKAIDATEF